MPWLLLGRAQEDVLIGPGSIKITKVQQADQHFHGVFYGCFHLEASIRLSHGSTLDAAPTPLNRGHAGRVDHVTDVLTQSFRFADPRDLADLRTFVTRAKSIDDGAIRLQAAGTVLAAYVCVLRPRILGESTPTILGLRTMALAEPAHADVTVTLASVMDRLARSGADDVELPIPPSTVSESWAGVGAPRSGWEAHGAMPDADLKVAAEAGIAEVAGVIPTAAGAAVVNSARAAVWGRELPGAAGLPAGAAFAAFALGFLGDAEQKVFRNGRWFRLSGPRGHVLVRTGAGLGLGF